MYSTHKEGKSVVTEKFIRSLKNKIYKYMTSTSKNVDIDNLAVIVNKYNNTYHNTIKMKPAVLKSITNLDLTKTIKRMILNLRLMIMIGYRNLKIFLQTITFKIGLTNFL